MNSLSWLIFFFFFFFFAISFLKHDELSFGENQPNSREHIVENQAAIYDFIWIAS